MSARAREARRRREERRQALLRAEREWVVGGPLVDHAAPVIGGGDAEHAEKLRRELEVRAAAVSREALRLAVHHALRCCRGYPELRFYAMVRDYCALTERAGPVRVQPTHSTRPGSTASTIPAL